MDYNDNFVIETNATSDIDHIIETVAEVARRLSQERNASQKNEPADVSVGNNEKPSIYTSENQDAVLVTEAKKRVDVSTTVVNASIHA